METIFEKISYCVEVGKINAATPYPPTMKGEDGADELTAAALAEGYSPNEVLTEGLIAGMNRTGVKFKENKVFVPQVLMSAKAMSSGMNHLKKYFADGSVKRKGKFIVGTVQGDLHDIGKNLVCMMVEGNGYEVIDLGVDVSKETFVEAVRKNPDAFVGMSALLTTTMVNMGPINEAIKAEFPKVKTFVGGAPVNGDFAQKIGVDYYTEEPQKLVEILNRLAAN